MTAPAMNQDKSLRKEIRFLAYAGWSPKQIEEKLGISPYTIHFHFHDDLQLGYLQHIARYDKLPAKIGRKTLNLTDEEKAQRKRDQYNQSYAKRKATGTLKKRTKTTKKKGRPKLKESDDINVQRKREISHRWYEKHKEKQIEIVKLYATKNKEKLQKYQREYYKRKCLEKQNELFEDAVKPTAFFSSEYLSRIP